MEAEAPASAGSFREESAALGVGMGGGGALDGEGGARAGKRGWSMTSTGDLTVSVPLQCQGSGASPMALGV